MNINMDPLNDVRNILKTVEHKVNDKIDILGCLKYMNKFSDQNRQQIEAQERQQGSGYSSSLFFDTIRSRPRSFFTLLAALLKLGQTDIYNICIKETRKYYSNKPDVFREVLDIIEKEKERIGVQDHEPDPVRNEGREIEEPCVRPRTGLSRTAQSAVFPQPPPQGRYEAQVPVLQRPYSSPAQLEECPSQFPGICGQIAGRGESIKLLKRNYFKKLAKELEEKQDRDDNDDDNDEPFCRLWYIIADHDGLNLDITQEDIDRIAESRQNQGQQFLNLLHDNGYTLDDLEVMFEHAGMDNAVALLKQRRESRRARQNNLNTGGSAINLEYKFSSLNIANPKEKATKEFKSLPTFEGNGKAQFGGSGPDLQPLQPSSASTESFSSFGSNSSTSNLTDDGLKSGRAIQSVGDPDGMMSVPNPSMDARKLTEDIEAVSPSNAFHTTEVISVRDQQLIEDTDSTAPKSSQVSDSRSFGDTVNTQSARGISTVVPSSISDNSSFTSGPVTASNTQALPPESQQNSGGPSPYWQNIPNITDSSQAGQKASPVSAWGHQAHLDRGQKYERTQAVDAECYTSIPISSYAESSVHSVDDIEEDGTSLKMTVAVQPTSAQQQFAPDYRGEAEKLRYDRIHQLDNDPSNLPSFQNVQKEQEQQQGETQLPSTTNTHEFRSTMATPDLKDSLNITTDESQANVGTTNATAGETRENGDETTGATNATAGETRETGDETTGATNATAGETRETGDETMGATNATAGETRETGDETTGATNATADETRETGDETMGATNATAGETRETGDETKGATYETSEIIQENKIENNEENKTQNVPRFSLMDSHSSDTADNSVE